jgi:hypothetical protein
MSEVKVFVVKKRYCYLTGFTFSKKEWCVNSTKVAGCHYAKQ